MVVKVVGGLVEVVRSRISFGALPITHARLSIVEYRILQTLLKRLYSHAPSLVFPGVCNVRPFTTAHTNTTPIRCWSRR